MSFTTTTKGKAHAASSFQEETMPVSESQPPPIHSARSSGKNVVRDYQAEGSSAAQTTFPSSFRAVDEGTPAYSAVEDANDQLKDEGIRRPSNKTNSPSPEDWAAAQQEIAALRTANQRLLRRSEQGNHSKP